MDVSSDSDFEQVVLKTTSKSQEKPPEPTIEEISSQINALTFLLQEKQAEKARQGQK